MTGSGLAYLEARAMWDGSRPFGLETPTALLHALGNPQDAIPTIHIAGTNGKGSVAAFCAAMLLEDGKEVGQFTSPHLCDVSERCIMNGVPVSEAAFDEALAKVRSVAESIELEPSFFEVTAAATFLVFAEAGLDYAVIEVGLGGRLDATNVIKAPVASAIVSIGWDHMHWLGETLAEIAWEKAGIIKEDVPVFVGDVPDEARNVIASVAEERGAPLTQIDSAWRDRAIEQRLALSGKHQVHNASLAATLASQLGASDAAILRAFRSVRWPGRLEEFTVDSVSVTMDAAHNEDAIEALCEHLESTLDAQQPLVFLISILGRKDWKKMLSQLSAFAEGRDVHFIFTTCGNTSCVPPEEMCLALSSGQASKELSEAFSLAVERGKEKSANIIVCGSSYLVGALRPRISGSQFRTWSPK